MQHFHYTVEKQQDWEHIHLKGPINEDAEVVLPQLEQQLATQCIFYFDEVSNINSCGVRAWIHFIRRNSAKHKMIYEGCTPEIVSQINMIPDFKGNATIKSVLASYHCPSCDTTQLIRFERGVNLPQSADEGVEAVACPNCNNVMENEELEEEFFAWVDQA